MNRLQEKIYPVPEAGGGGGWREGDGGAGTKPVMHQRSGYRLAWSSHPSCMHAYYSVGRVPVLGIGGLATWQDLISL